MRKGALQKPHCFRPCFAVFPRETLKVRSRFRKTPRLPSAAASVLQRFLFGGAAADAAKSRGRSGSWTTVLVRRLRFGVCLARGSSLGGFCVRKGCWGDSLATVFATTASGVAGKRGRILDDWEEGQRNSLLSAQLSGEEVQMPFLQMREASPWRRQMNKSNSGYARVLLPSQTQRQRPRAPALRRSSRPVFRKHNNPTIDVLLPRLRSSEGV